jgi:hypothetical protein
MRSYRKRLGSNRENYRSHANHVLQSVAGQENSAGPVPGKSGLNFAGIFVTSKPNTLLSCRRWADRFPAIARRFEPYAK